MNHIDNLSEELQSRKIRTAKFSMLLGVAAIFINLLLVGKTCASVTFGQIDDFESGTTLNWANGGAPPPLNINTGGPAGPNDNFLKITADGSGSTGKLTVFNRDQWIGDYVGQGIGEIDLDLENLGSVPLTIRLAFKATTANGAPGYLSAGISLPADSTWHHAVFQLTPAAMTALGGPAAFNTFFDDGMVEMRIINEVGTSNLNGDNISSTLGIDNIQAVPEPNTIGLFFSAACGVFLLRHRRRGPALSTLSAQLVKIVSFFQPATPKRLGCFLSVLFMLGAACNSQALTRATGKISSAPLAGGLFQYTITLTNTGSTGIQTFWFAWVPGGDFMATSPGNIASPGGWTRIVTNAGSSDGFAIQWQTSSSPLAAGASLSFSFQSADSPSAMAGNSVFFPSIPVGTSVVYEGMPFAGGSDEFVVSPAAGSTTSSSALKIKIAGPKRISTRKSKVTIKGTATRGVTGVTYRIGAKASRPAIGTTAWHFVAALKKGANLITVTAHGRGAASAPAKIVITRK